jgi:hypothetical protein
MDIIRRLWTKPTIFLIAGILGIVYAIPMTIYSFTLTGGGSLIALGYIEFIFISGLAIVIDSGLITRYNLIKTSAIIVYLLYSFNNRTAYIDIQQLNKPYLVVIDDKQGISKKDFSMAGVFDIEYTIKDKDVLQLDKQTLENYYLTYKTAKKVPGPYVSSNYKPEYKFDWDFVAPYDANKIYTDKQRDSILKTKLPPHTVIYNPNFKGY